MRLDSPQENGCSFSLSDAQHFKVHRVFHIYYVIFLILCCTRMIQSGQVTALVYKGKLCFRERFFLALTADQQQLPVSTQVHALPVCAKSLQSYPTLCN